MQTLIGKTLGQYKITAEIGQGGMATVYKAHQPGLDRWVAVKVLPPQYAADPDFRRYFSREAKAIAQLEHPHILPVYDFGQQGPYIYLVMRYIEESRSLVEVLLQPRSFSQTLHYLKQTATALDYAHKRGIIHRDVKPANVLLNEDWVFLADFGLARLMASTTHLTNTSVGSGTPLYMSPEQGAGDKIDARTDIYALGVIAFQMFSGQIPHLADNIQAIIYKRNHQPPPSLREVNPAVPALIDQAVQTALATRPEDRFATAGAFVTALNQAIQESQTGERLTPATEIPTLAPAAPEAALPPTEQLPAPAPGPKAAVAPPAPVERPAGSGPPRWLWAVVGGVGLLILLLAGSAGLLWLARTGSGSAENSAGQASSPAAVTSRPTGSAANAYFVDDFDGTSLRNVWRFRSGGGQIQVYGGNLRLTGSGQSFPLIYPTVNIFPPEEDFRLTVSWRYLSVASRGTGLFLGSGSPAAPSEAVPILQIQQDDQAWRLLGGESSLELYRQSAPGLDPQQIEISYRQERYRVSLNGQTIYDAPASGPRPSLLWLGSPRQTDAGGNWSGLEIDQIKVEIVDEPPAPAAQAATATATPPPSPTPLASSRPSPTPSPSPTVTASPTPLGQNCSARPADLFAGVWENHRARLGCPQGQMQVIPTMAEESFQGGHLFWRSDTDQVYIILDREDGAWLEEGRWRPADPSQKWDGSNPDGVGLSPPPGLVEPKRGFGWLWRTHLGGPDGPLGWALDKEYGFDNTGRAQMFEEGIIFKGSGPRFYVLLENGRFYVEVR